MKNLVYAIVILLTGIAIGHNLARPSAATSVEPVSSAQAQSNEPAAKIMDTESLVSDEEASSGMKVGYHLIVGAFSKDYFLTRVKEKLHAKGYTVNTHRTRMKKALVEVVEVGPFKTLAAAEKHASSIETELEITKVLIRKRVNE